MSDRVIEIFRASNQQKIPAKKAGADGIQGVLLYRAVITRSVWPAFPPIIKPAIATSSPVPAAACAEMLTSRGSIMLSIQARCAEMREA